MWGWVFEIKWGRTPATDLVGIQLRAETAIKRAWWDGGLSYSRLPQDLGLMERTEKDGARGVEYEYVWLVLPEPVRTWLIFFMPNSLVQPLALNEAVAEPEPKWIVL